MRTTLDLPDALMREVKIRAAQQDRKLKEVVEELLRLGLKATGGAPEKRQRPVVKASRPARAQADEVSARKVSQAARKKVAEVAKRPASSSPPSDASVIDSSFPL